MNTSEWKNRVAELGCLICRMPAELHHTRFSAGLGQRASDYLVIPLCPEHHRTGGAGVAIHAGQQTFEGLYGTEVELLSRTIKEASQ